MLHSPYPGQMATAGNFAIPLNPPETPTGPVCRFSVYHLMEVDSPTDMFPVALHGDLTMTEVPLRELAKVIRSKNAGPVRADLRHHLRPQGGLRGGQGERRADGGEAGRLYGIPLDDILVVDVLRPGHGLQDDGEARAGQQGTSGERDTFGAPAARAADGHHDPVALEPQDLGPRAMTSTESEKLGQFALDLTLDAIPGDVLTLAKEHFLDALGIALASSRFDFGEAILNGARALGDGTQATAIGSGVRLPAPSAALGQRRARPRPRLRRHPYRRRLSRHLARACRGPRGGRGERRERAEVLIAFTSALEIGCRLVTVGAGAFNDRAFHPTALCGTFAAAVVARPPRQGDHETMTWALGLWGS